MLRNRSLQDGPILYWFLVDEVPAGGAPVEVRRLVGRGPTYSRGS